jgi:hypothetical protein
VLLITNYISKKADPGRGPSLDVIYNILSNMKTVKLTVFDAYDETLENKNIFYLINFDLVVIDLLDGGYSLWNRCPKFTKNLITYVKIGGALFSGHDQFDNTHKRFIKQEAIDMLALLGFTHENSWGYSGRTAYFDKSAIDGSIFLVDYVFLGDSINIASTHQTYSKFDPSCKTCKVIMKFYKDGPDETEYLVTNRPNLIGKTVSIRAGHTTPYTEGEKRIFTSSILWLLYDI